MKIDTPRELDYGERIDEVRQIFDLFQAIVVDVRNKEAIPEDAIKLDSLIARLSNEAAELKREIELTCSSHSR